MSPLLRATLIWMPRLAGLAMVLFLSLFALDAFAHPASPGEALLAFAIHLAPAAVVAGVVASAWRVPMLGAALFPVLAAAYAASVHDRPDWIAVISGPLAAIAMLYALSAYARRRAGSSIRT